MSRFAFAAGDPVGRMDVLGLAYVGYPLNPFWPPDQPPLPPWPPFSRPPPPPPPPPPDPVGFALCMRDANPENLGEWILLIAFRLAFPGAPTDHAYIHYKRCSDCETVGWGIGGTLPGYKPKEEGTFNPNDCKPCRRTSAVLAYGDSGKTGELATDEEIVNCIKLAPTTKRYKPYGKGRYNCLDWAKEASSKCGLDCN